MTRSAWALPLAVLAAVVALTLAALRHLAPPSPLAADAYPSLFSSARAMRHLQTIARQSHPLGSAEHEQVCAYLLAELNALGLEAQIQPALAIHHGKRMSSVGAVKNVLVRVAGKIPGKALLVVAHYDSTPAGPGAADDGASVAAMLETLRTLKSLPALRNDLIFLFTDGEEAGLLGAEAFVAENPWAKNIGLALNFEFRGNRGPMLMFETSIGNAKLIRAFAEAVPHPFGNSLMYEIYMRLPNDTDLTVFKRAGIAGMNFAAIEGHTSYHTQLDRPELLQEASLQHAGETMLGLVRYYGDRALEDLRSSDSVYFDMPGFGLVQYSIAWIIPLCTASILTFAAVLALGLKIGGLRASRTVLAVPVFFVVVLAIAFASQLLWAFIKFMHPQYQLMPHGDTYNSHWYLPAFVLLAMALFGFIQTAISAWIRPPELSAGVMAVWLMLLVAASLALPGASFLLFWPLAPVLLTAGILFWQHDKNLAPFNKTALIIAATAPAIVMFAPFLKTLFVALTPNKIGVIAGFLALLLGLLTPLLELLAHNLLLRWAPLIAGLILLLAGSLNAGFDIEHPRPNHLFYALDSGMGRAYWLSADKRLDDWTGTFFTAAKEKRRRPELFGEKSPTYWTGPAPVLPLLAPVIEVVKDSVDSEQRKLNVRIRSPRQAPEFHVFVEGTGVIESKVEQRLFTLDYESAWQVRAFGLSGQSLTIELTVKAGAPFAIRVVDYSYGLPETGLPPRPAGMIGQPFGMSDTAAVVSTVVFR